MLKKQLLAERVLLIRALQFYADEANWKVIYNSKSYKLHNPATDVDVGDRARIALKDVSLSP